MNRIGGSGPARRPAGLWSQFVDTFLRDNKVIPTVLALLALFVVAWVLAEGFLGGPGEPLSSQANLAQQQEGGTDPLAPDIENRDVESYAAYQSKDPFRQLLASAESTEATTPEDTGFDEITTTPGGATPGGATPGGGAIPGGATPAAGPSDSDGDGLSTRKEEALGLDSRNPDSDGDGIPDGADDADGDGVPDGRAGGRGAPGTGPGAGGRPGGGSLPDSGGGIYPSR